MTTFVLRPDNARDRMGSAWEFAKSILQFGKPARVTVEEAQSVRSLEQNAMFHAICGEVAAKREWCGQRLDCEGWKRLFVDAWARTSGKTQARVVPSLDGQSVVALGIQTRRLPIADMADLIEFAQAWCVDNNVELSK